jgi:hypothetical protein
MALFSPIYEQMVSSFRSGIRVAPFVEASYFSGPYLSSSENPAYGLLLGNEQVSHAANVNDFELIVPRQGLGPPIVFGVPVL